MDVCFLSSDERVGFSCFKGEIDGKIEKILGELNRGNIGEIAKKLIPNFTKSALLDCRKKVFSIVVAKDEEKWTLATADPNKAVPATEEQLALYGQSPASLRLGNRHSKTLIVNDIASLILHIEYVSDPFPFHILKKLTEKGKSDAKGTSDTRKTRGKISDWVLIDAGEDSNQPEVDAGEDSNQPEVDTEKALEEVAPINVTQAQEKQIEGAVITETAADTRADGGAGLPTLVVSMLKDSSTTTKDLLCSRSIATQTESTGAIVSVDSDVPRSQDNTDSKSDDSVLEYIDCEFEALQNNGAEMNAAKRRSSTPTRCEKRFVELEQKYLTVMKRVAQLEKLHDDDVKAIREDIQRECYNPDDTTCTESGRSDTATPRNTARRHSESDIIVTMSPDNGTRSNTPSDSAWDPETTDVFVCTQNTQGDLVTTKATPIHKEEIAARNKACHCACSKDQGVIPAAQHSSVVGGQKPRNTRQTANRKEEDFTVQRTSAATAKAVAPSSVNQPKRPAGDKAPNIMASQTRPLRENDRTTSRANAHGGHNDNRNMEQQRQRTEQPPTAAQQNISRPAKQKPLDNGARCGDPDDLKRRKLDNQYDNAPSTSGYKRAEPAINASSAGKSTSSLSSTGITTSNSDNAGKGSYADVASDGEWNTQGSRNNG